MNNTLCKHLLSILFIVLSSQAFADNTLKKQTDSSNSILGSLLDAYEESAKTDETLKHLLDAKMYLSTSEHDLFISHDKESARNDMESTLAYLLEAENTAKPKIKTKISALIKDLKVLEKKTAAKEESGQYSEVDRLLNTAQNNLAKAKKKAPLSIKKQIDSLILDVLELRKKIEHDNLMSDYESVINRLNEIIKTL